MPAEPPPSLPALASLAVARKDLALRGALEHLAPGPWVERADTPDGVITAVRRLAPVEARYEPFSDRLDPRLRAALERRGVTQLYSHQAEAFERVAAGEHVVVATPTASGKTLCYNLPVLDALLKDAAARALYLFPTKALAQDQMAELHELATLVAEAGGRRHRRAHLRRRHAGRRAQGDPRAGRTSSSPIPTCCTPASCRTTPRWAQAVREPALRRDRRAAHLPRRLRQPPGQRAAPAAAHRASLRRRTRSSSAARRRSPTRASSPSG